MDAKVIALHDIAGLIGDAARATILEALLGGRALTAGELALIAGISPQNASSHLARLLRGQLIDVEIQGRHRYYRLATPEVAAALEGLAALSSGIDGRLCHWRSLDEISFARTCYDHLAGTLAVKITSELLRRRFIADNGRDFLISPAGSRFFSSLGIDLAKLENERRAFARKCLDWTERRPHIAGALGAAMLSRFKELDCVAHIRNSRALRVTLKGQRRFKELFAISHFEPSPRR